MGPRQHVAGVIGADLVHGWIVGGIGPGVDDLVGGESKSLHRWRRERMIARRPGQPAE
jgi:hypothetical protein